MRNGRPSKSATRLSGRKIDAASSSCRRSDLLRLDVAHALDRLLLALVLDVALEHSLPVLVVAAALASRRRAVEHLGVERERAARDERRREEKASAAGARAKSSQLIETDDDWNERRKRRPERTKDEAAAAAPASTCSTSAGSTAGDRSVQARR